jgi:hypothetical protein
VEIGARPEASFDVDTERARVLDDLAQARVTDGHELVSWHSVTLDPAIQEDPAIIDRGQRSVNRHRNQHSPRRNATSRWILQMCRETVVRR